MFFYGQPAGAVHAVFWGSSGISVGRQVFLIIKRSLKRCSALTRNATLFNLYKVCFSLLFSPLLSSLHSVGGFRWCLELTFLARMIVLFMSMLPKVLFENFYLLEIILWFCKNKWKKILYNIVEVSVFLFCFSFRFVNVFGTFLLFTIVCRCSSESSALMLESLVPGCQGVEQDWLLLQREPKAMWRYVNGWDFLQYFWPSCVIVTETHI